MERLTVVVEAMKPERRKLIEFVQVKTDQMSMKDLNSLVYRRVDRMIREQWSTQEIVEFRWEYKEIGQGHYVRNERYIRFTTERDRLCEAIDRASEDREWTEAERLSKDLLELEMAFYGLL